MCVRIWFRHEAREVGSIAELADMIGGPEGLRVEDGYPPLETMMEGCLCPINVEATLRDSDWHLLRWEDGCDFTAVKSSFAIERDQRAHDKARYDAAMAETRATPA